MTFRKRLLYPFELRGRIEAKWETIRAFEMVEIPTRVSKNRFVFFNVLDRRTTTSRTKVPADSTTALKESPAPL